MRNMTKQRRMAIKRILLGLGGILVFGSAAHAKFDGFYAGASVGYLNQNTSLDAKQDPADPNVDAYNSTTGRGLPTAEFFFGWGKVFEGCFYGGLEGKVDWVKGGIKKVAEDTNFMYLSGRKGPGVATLARLGYLTSPYTMIYGGIGIKATWFAYNLFEKADQIPAPFSKRSMRLLTEVGVETALNTLENLVFRFSYSFMPKRDMLRKATNFPVNHMYRENGVFKVSTAEHAVKVGLVYHF